MCRLVGVIAETEHVATETFRELRRCSHEHRDGWGLASFHGEIPHIEKGLSPAYACSRFDQLSKQTHSASWMLHLRLASIGALTYDNAHPFTHGPWAFAHNGTIENFHQNKQHLENLIVPEFRQMLRGDTDSERCFRLFSAGLNGKDQTATELEIAQILAQTARAISTLCDVGATKRSAMNFMVSDGKRMVVTRRGRGLYLHESPDIVMVSSEPFPTQGSWVEIPEESVMTIDADRNVKYYNLNALAS